jgi:hypothetical protein
MLNKTNLTICLISLSAISSAQEFNTSFGSVKYKINSDNTISYLGSNVHYKFSDFAYKVDMNNKSTTHNLSYSSNLFNANFTKTTGENPAFVSSFKFKNFSFVDQQLMNQRIQSFSYFNKDLQLDYISAQNPIITKDYWNRNISSKNYLSMNYKGSSGKFIDDYYAVNLNFGPINLLRAHSKTQSENNFQYKDSVISVKWSNFDNTRNQKDFFDISSKIFSLKSAKDMNINAQVLSFGNTTLAHNDSQNYVQSRIGDLSYKLAQNKDKIDYGIAYKGLSYSNEQWFYTSNLNKNLSVQFGSDGKIHQANYNAKFKDTNISIKYTDEFDLFDFYFNQNVFSIYDNSFNMIGNTKTQYKNSTSIALNSSRYSLNVDAINNMWNFNFKANKEFNFGYLKDQKNNHINLSDISKYGTITIGYNIDKEKIDRLGVSMKIEF